MRKLVKSIVASGAVIAFGSGLLAAQGAHAEYFVRPVLQYYGEMEDGISIDSLTKNSATFNDGFSHLEAHVDLASGTIKTFAEMNGPTDVFGAATGIMGDRITYTGSNDELVSFRFDFDAMIAAVQQYTGTPSEFEERYIGIEAHFAIYEVGSGAYWEDWTEFGSNSHKALFASHEITTFQHEPEEFSLFYESSLGSDLYLTSGKSYDIFAAYNLVVTPGSLVGSITMNALNTSTIGIYPQNGSFTSESGEFLGFAQTPPTSPIPEPATWAMMIGGFCLAGAAMRQRKARVTATCA